MCLPVAGFPRHSRPGQTYIERQLRDLQLLGNLMTGYDPPPPATLPAVEQPGSFPRPPARLGLQQPTVSQHIRRLEEQVGRTLVLRDTHSVSLTADGPAMGGFARNILATSEQAAA